MEFSKEETLNLVNDAFERRRYGKARGLAVKLLSQSPLLSCEDELLVAIAIQAGGTSKADFRLAGTHWSSAITRLKRKNMVHVAAPYGIRLAESYLGRGDSTGAWNAFQSVRDFVTREHSLQYNQAIEQYEYLFGDNAKTKTLRLP